MFHLSMFVRVVVDWMLLSRRQLELLVTLTSTLKLVLKVKLVHRKKLIRVLSNRRLQLLPLRWWCLHNGYFIWAHYDILKKVVWYFEDGRVVLWRCGVILWRRSCGTLKICATHAHKKENSISSNHLNSTTWHIVYVSTIMLLNTTASGEKNHQSASCAFPAQFCEIR